MFRVIKLAGEKYRIPIFSQLGGCKDSKENRKLQFSRLFSWFHSETLFAVDGL
jgi:hypothetical protein